MKTTEELKTLSVQIEELLKEDERCRNDDKWLTYRVMRHYTNIYIPFEDFQKMPAFESIKRIRAIYQNKKKMYLPTSDEVIKKRQLREKDFVTFMREV